jgi:hypothetical protein
MKAIDITGKRFGRLVAVRDVGVSMGSRLWECLCDCGKTAEVTNRSLKNANTKSCGCLNADLVSARNKANATHGMTGTPEWVSWDNMIQRCTNANHKSFDDYGGRGIVVVPDWRSFERFYADMGDRPAGTTLDRREQNGNYDLGNCRWATLEQQSNNKRSSRFIVHAGRKQTVAQWAAEIGISRHALMFRSNNDWSVEEALTMKLGYGNGWVRGVRS